MPNVAAFLADSAKVAGRSDDLPMKPDTCGHATREAKTKTFITHISEKAIGTDFLLMKRGKTTNTVTTKMQNTHEHLSPLSMMIPFLVHAGLQYTFATSCARQHGSKYCHQDDVEEERFVSAAHG